VTYSTTDGTATAGSDYVAEVNTSVVIPAGATTFNVTVYANGDTATEGDESFLVTFSLLLANGTVASTAVTNVTVLDDDVSGGAAEGRCTARLRPPQPCLEPRGRPALLPSQPPCQDPPCSYPFSCPVPPALPCPALPRPHLPPSTLAGFLADSGTPPRPAPSPTDVCEHLAAQPVRR
jgi:hypothetical protein